MLPSIIIATPHFSCEDISLKISFCNKCLTSEFFALLRKIKGLEQRSYSFGTYNRNIFHAVSESAQFNPGNIVQRNQHACINQRSDCECACKLVIPRNKKGKVA
jgi:hypothetical protein